MQLLENALSDDDIAVLKNYWEKNNHLYYINAYTADDHAYREKSDFIDRRLLIVEGTKAWNVVRKVVDTVLPGEPIWANFQQQTICHELHVDEYGKDRENPTWTIILALEDQPKFKAVIFKEIFNDGFALSKAISELPYDQPPQTNVSETDDCDHMDKWVNGKNYNWCNWLTLDGVFTYRKGWGVLFDSNQAHTTSNWVKYPEFTYRQLVQIHIGKTALTNDTHAREGRGQLPPDDAYLKTVLVE
jgi:hypothetical protein